MNILITGGAGFIGSQLYRRLSDQGHTIGSIDTVQGREFDIRYISKIAENVDHIFHLAALTKIPYCILEPQKCIDVNVGGTVNMLQCAIEADFKGTFIFASSSAIYDCANVYAASKRGGEALCQAYDKNFGLNIQIARFFNVYGQGQHPDSNVVINNFIIAKKKGNKAKIFGTGHQTRDFIHVDDVVSALIAMIGGEDATPYDIGTGIETSINELADMMELEMTYVPARDGDPHKSVAKDVDRTKTELEWEPKIKLKNWLEGR